MAPYFKPGAKKALLFDLNGTLIDREKSRLAALKEILEEFSGRWEGGDWGPEETVRRFAAARRGNPGAEGRPVRALRAALRGAPLGGGETFARMLWERAKAQAPRRAAAYSDAKDTLRKLAGSYRLAIVSNGSRDRLAQALKASGLDELFPAELRFVSDRRTGRKPAPGLFREALRKLDVKPSEAVMIGDSWRSDVRGAGRLGIDAVWLRRKASPPKRLGRLGKSRVIAVSRLKDLLAVFGTD